MNNKAKLLRIIAFILLLCALFSFGCAALEEETEDGERDENVKYLIAGAVGTFVLICAADILIGKVKKKNGDK